MTDTPKMTPAERMAKARAARASKRAAAPTPFAAAAAATPVRRAAHANAALKMKARPNWDEAPDDSAEGPDKLHISRDLVEKCRRDYGLDLQWVTTEVYGKPQPQRVSQFTKKHWTQLHNTDLDGMFDGMFVPKGSDGEIAVDGLVLMARPLELSEKSRARERRDANLPVQIKEHQLNGGDLPGVSLDTRHKTVRNTVNRSIERIEIAPDSD